MNKELKAQLKEGLENVFDILWIKADALIKTHNPCQFKKDDKGCHSCLAMRLKGREDLKTGCCDGCHYLTPNGCGANQPLQCKLWLCNVNNYKNGISDLHFDNKVLEELAILTKTAWDFFFMSMFNPRKDRKHIIESAIYNIGYRKSENYILGKISDYLTQNA